jgi:hypothetical protein
MKRNEPAPAPRPEAEPQQQPDIPKWVTETPADHLYELEMFESSDRVIETIELTRDEYIELKEHLAAMRGYTKEEA